MGYRAHLRRSKDLPSVRSANRNLPKQQHRGPGNGERFTSWSLDYIWTRETTRSTGRLWASRQVPSIRPKIAFANPRHCAPGTLGGCDSTCSELGTESCVLFEPLHAASPADSAFHVLLERDSSATSSRGWPLCPFEILAQTKFDKAGDQQMGAGVC